MKLLPNSAQIDFAPAMCPLLLRGSCSVFSVASVVKAVGFDFGLAKYEALQQIALSPVASVVTLWQLLCVLSGLCGKAVGFDLAKHEALRQIALSPVVFVVTPWQLLCVLSALCGKAVGFDFGLAKYEALPK